MYWFTSDTHAFHRNIIKYSNRPFANEIEMTEALAANINAVVQPNDTLYHLGDWAWNGRIHEFRDMINCKNVVLILGNHDKEIARNRGFYNSAFKGIYDLTKVRCDGQEIVLCHYSMRVWNKSHRGVWHLYGHSHGSLPDDPNSLSFDVGVDCHNYHPINLDDVATIMSKKTFIPIDHHV